MKRATSKFSSTFTDANNKPQHKVKEIVKPVPCYPHNHKVSGLIEAIVHGAYYTWDADTTSTFTFQDVFNSCKLQTSLEYPFTALNQPTDRVLIGKEDINNVMRFAPITNSYISASVLGVTPSELMFYMATITINGEPDLKVDVKTGNVIVSLGNLYTAVMTAVFNPSEVIRVVTDADNADDYLTHFAPFTKVTKPDGTVKNVAR